MGCADFPGKEKRVYVQAYKLTSLQAYRLTVSQGVCEIIIGTAAFIMMSGGDHSVGQFSVNESWCPSVFRNRDDNLLINADLANAFGNS